MGVVSSSKFTISVISDLIFWQQSLFLIRLELNFQYLLEQALLLLGFTYR